MDFKTATGRLLELGVTIEEIATAIGVSRATVKAARLVSESPSHRSPPHAWREGLRRLVQERGAAFRRLGEDLEDV